MNILNGRSRKPQLTINPDKYISFEIFEEICFRNCSIEVEINNNCGDYNNSANLVICDVIVKLSVSVFV